MRRLAHISYLAAALCFAFAFFDVVYRGESLVPFPGVEIPYAGAYWCSLALACLGMALSGTALLRRAGNSAP